MLQWIAMSYSNPVQTHKLPLQQLKNASLAHWDSEGSCEVDWACLFLSIPSVQRFAANAMGRAPYTLGVEIYQANRCSNVTELWLDHCGLELDGLVTLLRGINDLRKLRYTHGGSMVSEYPYEPKRIIQAIEDTVGHSLEELTLEQDLYFVSLSSHPLTSF